MEFSRSVKLTENLLLIEGDMFFSRMQTLTVTVNTVGVMGKGLALRIKEQFPDVHVKYRKLCKDKILKMGSPYLYKREIPFLNLQTWFLLFPTKADWREKSDLEGIERGLKWLVDNYKKEGIKSLAIPALGCGLGRLSWKTVGPIMCSYLQKLDIPVRLYLPLERRIPDEEISKEFLLKRR